MARDKKRKTISMGYTQALEKAWNDIRGLTREGKFQIALLSDKYDIDLATKKIISLSCNIPAKEYVSILILHYLIQKLKLRTLPSLTGEWADFNQLEGTQGYYPAFKKRTIDHLLKKYGPDPDSLLEAAGRMPSKRCEWGDVGVIVYPFEDVPILMTMWRADSEFGPEANILFDKSISKIFCAEDIVVLAECVIRLI